MTLLADLMRTCMGIILTRIRHWSRKGKTPQEFYWIYQKTPAITAGKLWPWYVIITFFAPEDALLMHFAVNFPGWLREFADISGKNLAVHVAPPMTDSYKNASALIPLLIGQEIYRQFERCLHNCSCIQSHRRGLGAIIWTNDDTVQLRIYASVGSSAWKGQAETTHTKCKNDN